MFTITQKYDIIYRELFFKGAKNEKSYRLFCYHSHHGMW